MFPKVSISTSLATFFFCVSCLASAQEVTLYNFRGSGSSDGSVPDCNLVMDAAGNLYGTTNSGGAVGAPNGTNGTIFELLPGAGGTWTEKVLYSFGATAGDGIQPAAGLVFDTKGNLYGTTGLGGANGAGTVFEMSPGAGGTWTEKVLYSFGASATDGNDPRRGSLILDSKGNLYGTTLYGGTNTVSNGAGVVKAGTVFELSPGAGGTWTEKILYNFGATATDAANSVAGLVMDASGNLYGTTAYGGSSNSGTAFELTPGAGGTWTESVIHSFADNGTDGSIPEAGLTLDAQGNLYGTTDGGGSNPFFGGFGVVFELSPAGGGNWSEQILYSFGSAVGVGDYPLGPVTFDAAGNLYGTASSGLYAYGLVFKLAASQSGWTYSTLYYFGPTPDGHDPANGVIFDSKGNLYGTTSTGGPLTADSGLGGTVYQIPAVVTPNPTFSPSSGAYASAQTVMITDTVGTATIYYSIDGGAYTKYTGAIQVSASEIIDAVAIAGTLPQSQATTANYQIGTTAEAPQFWPPEGSYSVAQSISLSTAAPGATIYYTTNGIPPTISSAKYAGPISVSATETIEAFAAAPGYVDSPVASANYTITPPIIPKEGLIYSFLGSGGDGATPVAGLVSDASGNLYGTTKAGGTTGYGTAFKLTPATGGSWKETVLYSFGANTNDGKTPTAGLVFDSKGNLYGTTYYGGTLDDGTVFKLTPAASGPWTETILHNFDYITNDGIYPQAGLIFDAKGNLYGTTYGGGANSSGGANPGGTVFELTPATGGAWTESLLHSFNYLNTSDGYYPQGGLAFDTKGNLYGTTSDGGASQDSQGGGTVFELTPGTGGAWTEKILRSYGGCAEFCPDGFTPNSGLVVDALGNVYGTLSTGGPNGFGADGMAFELSPGTGGTWTEKILHSFGAYEADGTKPQAGMALDPEGNLYGTTNAGGANGLGTVFKLTPQTDGSWQEGILHSFTSNPDGANPAAGLLLDAAGDLYGATSGGGTSYAGGVFKVASVITANPKISPPGGVYTSAQSITISDATTGATIYYTTNGSTPTTSSAKYASAIVVSGWETIKAMAVATGLPQSQVATASYQIGTPTPAKMTSPTPATVLASVNDTFTWTSASGATGYYLSLGSTGVGSSNLYKSAELATTSAAVTNLPANGAPIYARLSTSYNGTLINADYTYTAPTKSALTSPVPGSTLTGSSATFKWTTAPGATGYALWLGSTGVGSSNLYKSATLTATSVTVNGLPTAGATIYARLTTVYGAAGKSTDYTYKAATAATLTSPTPGTVLGSINETFTWTSVTGATSYSLVLGSLGVGSSNLFNSGTVTGTSVAVSNLPANGLTIYARLSTTYSGTVYYNDYTYTAPTKAALTSPTPGSTFTSTSVTFKWTTALGATGYTLLLGSTGVGSNNLYKSVEFTTTSATVTGLPTNGETVYARLTTVYGAAGKSTDYTYKAQ